MLTLRTGPQVSWHRFLVMIGVNLPTVQDLMGYKDISTILRCTHLSSSHTQGTVRTFETSLLP